MAFPYGTLKTWSASGGSGSAGGVPLLNSMGVLDPSLINAITSTGGVAQAGAIPELNSAGVLDPSFFKGILKSVGNLSSGSVPLLNGAGILDNSFLPALSGANYLQVGTTVLQGGTITLPIPTGGNFVTSGTFNFGIPLSNVLGVWVTYASANGVNTLSYLPVFGVSNVTGGSALITAGPNSTAPINTPVPAYVLVLGTHA